MSFPELTDQDRNVTRLIEPHEEVLDREPASTILDRLLSREKPVIGSRFKAIGNGWVRLSPGEAEALLVELERSDLVYGMSRDTLPEWWRRDEFFSVFSAESWFFTNRQPNRSWRPLTDSTFDCGVAVLDADRYGLLWVQDED